MRRNRKGKERDKLYTIYKREVIDILSNVNGFEWDSGNIEKNWKKHKVSYLECEEIFLNEPLFLLHLMGGIVRLNSVSGHLEGQN